MWVLKLPCVILYFLAAFLGVPLLCVGTGMLIMHWLGDAWWVGLIIAPLVMVEFFGGLGFFLWEDNPIPDWLMS